MAKNSRLQTMAGILNLALSAGRLARRSSLATSYRCETPTERYRRSSLSAVCRTTKPASGRTDCAQLLPQSHPYEENSEQTLVLGGQVAEQSVCPNRTQRR